MHVENHLLIGADYRPSPNQSGALHDPSVLVIHYTAGRGFKQSCNWLTNPLAKASAHLVIGEAGEVAQLVLLKRQAWHAGTSLWRGKAHVNNRSIGIELDNAGKLVRDPKSGLWCKWFGGAVSDDRIYVHRDGSRWHSYPAVQLEKLAEVQAALYAAYPLQDCTGHEEIAPGRKTDPGPAFPKARFYR